MTPPPRMKRASGRDPEDRRGREVSWNLSEEDLLRALATTPAGLSESEATKRFVRSGPNESPRARRPSLLRLLLGEVTHFMALLLWGAGGLAFLSGAPELGWAIWIVVLLNGGFSFWQGFRAERALAALEQLLPLRVRVYRDEVLADRDARELVPGDVVDLRAGDRVPADARLLEARALSLDMSLLTGESVPQARAPAAPPIAATRPADAAGVVLAGTTVTSGRGRAVIYATGPGTELGQIARLTSAVRRERTTLEIQVAHVVRLISHVALVIGAAVFALALAAFGLEPRASFILAIGIIVANIPEGLLPTLTLALAMSVRRMARRRALVRRLAAIESLGMVSVICTDKTGTLTTNEMTVRAIWADRETIDVTGTGYEADGQVLLPANEAVAALVRQAMAAAVLCSNARLIRPAPGQPLEVSGDPTEAALVVAARKLGLSADDLHHGVPRLREVPFDPHRKRMTIVVRGADLPLFGGPLLAVTKGATSLVLPAATHVLGRAGIQPLTEATRAELRAAHDGLASRGYRVLAIAVRAGGEELALLDDAELETKLTLVALIAMLDPPRPETPAAVAACRRAGIAVTMVTGDAAPTALAIARQIGLLEGPATVVTGSQLDGMDDAALRDLTASGGPVVFARVVPEHKLRIVEAYRSLGRIVAATGDGVNDAPALRAAEVGVAMGRRGTDVAREAADVVLLDDNFATIANAIEEGRAVAENIRKFMTYILSSNVPEIVPFVAMAALDIPPALTILQILAVDLGTDIFPALALGTEPPEGGLMRESPRSPGSRLLDRRLLTHAYGFLGLLEAAAAMTAFAAVWMLYGFTFADVQDMTLALLRGADSPVYRAATTATVAAIVACQVGNVIACRTETASMLHGLRRNPRLWPSVLIELALLAAFVYVPGLRHVLHTESLPLWWWLALASLSPLMVVAETLRRMVVRARRRPPEWRRHRR